MKDTYSHVIKTGITPPSFRDAVISLTPKEGKDKTECGSYWPVSVLHQDYKIFTQILAKNPPPDNKSGPDRLYPAKADTR